MSVTALASIRVGVTVPDGDMEDDGTSNYDYSIYVVGADAAQDVSSVFEKAVGAHSGTRCLHVQFVAFRGEV